MKPFTLVPPRARRGRPGAGDRATIIPRRPAARAAASAARIADARTDRGRGPGSAQEEARCRAGRRIERELVAPGQVGAALDLGDDRGPPADRRPCRRPDRRRPSRRCSRGGAPRPARRRPSACEAGRAARRCRCRTASGPPRRPRTRSRCAGSGDRVVAGGGRLVLPVDDRRRCRAARARRDGRRRAAASSAGRSSRWSAMRPGRLAGRRRGRASGRRPTRRTRRRSSRRSGTGTGAGRDRQPLARARTRGRSGSGRSAPSRRRASQSRDTGEPARRDVHGDRRLGTGHRQPAALERPRHQGDRAVAAGRRIALVVEEDDAEVGALVVAARRGSSRTCRRGRVARRRGAGARGPGSRRSSAACSRIVAPGIGARRRSRSGTARRRCGSRPSRPRGSGMPGVGDPVGQRSSAHRVRIGSSDAVVGRECAARRARAASGLGHSSSVIAYQAESRTRPSGISMCLRKIPSNCAPMAEDRRPRPLVPGVGLELDAHGAERLERVRQQQQLGLDVDCRSARRPARATSSRSRGAGGRA